MILPIFFEPHIENRESALGPLGGVHRDIRPPQQHVRVFAMLRVVHNPDAGSYVYWLAFNHDR